MLQAASENFTHKKLGSEQQLCRPLIESIVAYFMPTVLGIASANSGYQSAADRANMGEGNSFQVNYV